jgi:uncharacterized protein YecE (DUF72 family)
VIRIGISGWRYEPWRGVFYPKGLAQRRELEYAARLFPSVEINGSFYSLQRPEFYAAWYRDTPPGFVFSVKGSRYITHMLKLKNVETPLANFFASGVLNLADKLGPFLWQLPPSLGFDADRLERFFALLPRDTAAALSLARRRDARMKGRSRLAIDENRPLRHAIEIRHPSFVDPAFPRLLRRHGVGLVVADTAGKWPLIEEVTAGFVYIRLHGDKKIYVSGYTDAALGLWARRIRAWAKRGDVYCYFDNDVKVKAPYDAQALMRRLGLHWGDQVRLARVPARIIRSGEGLGPRARARGDGFLRRSRTRTGGIPARR